MMQTAELDQEEELSVDWISDPQAWIGLVTLTVLELVLGIDNIVFISILAAKLPPDRQAAARRVGLLMALGGRVVLLFSLSLIIGLTAPLFTVFGYEISGRDLVLIAGGLFLIGKATLEIHERIEGEAHGRTAGPGVTFRSVIIQILLLDVVFSLDSVITAVGMVNELFIMITAVVVAIGVMIAFAEPVAGFINRHPTVKMLALSFLLMIGLVLVSDGLGLHIPKGYVYSAMAFSVFVEMLNLRVRNRPPLAAVQPKQGV